MDTMKRDETKRSLSIHGGVGSGSRISNFESGKHESKRKHVLTRAWGVEAESTVRDPRGRSELRIAECGEAECERERQQQQKTESESDQMMEMAEA